MDFNHGLLGPRIPDRIHPSEGKSYDLLVGSCRRKTGWNTYITLRYQDQLYEVLKEVDGRPPYRFLYQLRKNPRWRVTRKITDYDPEETLDPEYGSAI